jgi:dTDP-4-dehydrorhamnose reductase
VIAVLGASGQLGSAFVRLLGDSALVVDRAHLDLRDPDSIETWVDRERPHTIINCAAYTAVDAAETDEQTAQTVNARAVGILAESSAKQGARLVTFSTDYVFDGEAPSAYTESSTPNPLNAYGRTKLEGERLALAAFGDVLVVRTSWVMSGTHPNFTSKMIDLIAKRPVQVVDDQRGHPTFADDLAIATMAAIQAGASGILHLTNQGETTWFGLAREIAQIAGFDEDLVTACSSSDFQTPAQRPRNSVLESERLAGLGVPPLPHYRQSLETAIRLLRRDN